MTQSIEQLILLNFDVVKSVKKLKVYKVKDDGLLLYEHFINGSDLLFV